MAVENKECTFLWLIENYSYCFHDNGEKLVSPCITPKGLNGTSWKLQLFPRGSNELHKSKISILLCRTKHDDGPFKFSIRFELAVVTVDGSPLHSVQHECLFRKRDRYGVCFFATMEEVLTSRKSDCLPQDTLSVRCKIWRDNREIEKVEHFTARTRIGIEKISFLHRVENFSALNPDEKKTIQIRSQSKTGCVISSSLYFTLGSSSEGKLISEIVASDRKYVISKRIISLLNGSNKIIDCDVVDNRFDATRKDIQKLPLSLTRDLILDKKDEYLPCDELSLICECTFSTGIEFEDIVETQHELPTAALEQSCKDGYNAAEKLSACTTASEDMKAIYVNQCLTDVELKTETKTFPAHKVVLCARSPVFKSMLTNDMKEKNTDCIRVDDLEDDIVQQLLLFLYSDYLENLLWESAIKLYYAGDKYAIDKLKVLCSNFFVDNLSTTNASELLLLADTHNDFDLKHFVENFILKHKEQIIDFDEWKNLEKSNPQLVIKTMHLMVKGKK